MEALSRALRSFHEKHEKIKHTVHTVSVVYFMESCILSWNSLQLTVYALYFVFRDIIQGMEISASAMGSIRHGRDILYNPRRGRLVRDAMGNIQKC